MPKSILFLRLVAAKIHDTLNFGAVVGVQVGLPEIRSAFSVFGCVVTMGVAPLSLHGFGITITRLEIGIKPIFGVFVCGTLFRNWSLTL